MPKYQDPAEAFEEGTFLGGMEDLPKPDKKKPKTKKKKEPTACGQGSCSSDYIRSYN